MKKSIIIIFALSLLLLFSGCKEQQTGSTVVATTKPVCDFTAFLCQGTDISVTQLVTENVSCLHDYTIQVRQMRAIESADAVILSGAGLEAFLDEPLKNAAHVIDASQGIHLLCGDDSLEEGHDHEDHHHENDPHIWLNVDNARSMARNIYNGLITLYPEAAAHLKTNLDALCLKFDELDSYGQKMLSQLSSRDLITFHDGFAYFAEYWDLRILHSLEEEAGSEASAAELKELIGLVRDHNIPAIFTEENGSTSASTVVAAETGIAVYSLNMGMSEKDYFETMYHNIDTLKEALE